VGQKHTVWIVNEQRQKVLNADDAASADVTVADSTVLKSQLKVIKSKLIALQHRRQ